MNKPASQESFFSQRLIKIMARNNLLLFFNIAILYFINEGWNFATRMELPVKNFDIDTNSKHLKSLCARHNPDIFLGDIAHLLTMIDTPGIQVHPFQGLDSPLRQLTYLASLNLTSDPALIETAEEVKDKEWFEMVKYSIAVKAGYYDLLMPKEGEASDEYYKLYKVTMPVFMNYYDTGSLNYEEQDIERVKSFFTPFDKEIGNVFGLTVKDFLNIYNLIDEELFLRLNYPLTLLRKYPECKVFWDEQFKNKVHPFDWKYGGTNPNVIELVKYESTRGERFTIDADELRKKYDPVKVDRFLKLFTLIRKQNEYQYYTAKNPVLHHPIYQIKDGRYLIISAKQLITAIYSLLTDFATSDANGITERFYARRGKVLQEKIAELFKRFFKNQCYVYNEYTTELHGNGQDLLILYKGLSLIIEAKAGREPEPMRDVRKSFQKISIGFKKSIQEGYEQADRVKVLFDNGEVFDIYDKTGKKVYTVYPNKYHNYFSFVVTLNKFSQPQIDLSLMLNLNEDDDRYPFSVSIDDLEIILLTMIKLKKGTADLIRFLKWREELQGRLSSNDETEIWGAFMNNKDFKVPENKELHFKTFPEMGAFYDELYQKGLGFENEKNWDRKTSDKYLMLDPARMREAIEK
ncbi:MAG: hypothetical protein ACJ748_09680 [Flavisolibacter sp.]